jgi:hypothetical protein
MLDIITSGCNNIGGIVNVGKNNDTCDQEKF